MNVYNLLCRSMLDRKTEWVCWMKDIIHVFSNSWKILVKTYFDDL